MGESAQQLVVFVLGRQRFAVSLRHVVQVVAAVQWTPVPHAPDVVLGIIDFHGEIIPVVDLRRGLLHSALDVSVADQFIIIRTGSRTLAILVNNTQGVVFRDVTPLAIPGLGLDEGGSRQIAGAIALDDGLVLLHDIEQFLSGEELQKLDGALRERMLEGAR